MTPAAFTVSSLHTIGGTSLAVLLILHLVKRIPRVGQIPNFWLSVIIAEFVFGLTVSSMPAHIGEWVVLALNGLLSAAAATGSFHLISNTSNDSPHGGDSRDSSK